MSRRKIQAELKTKFPTLTYMPPKLPAAPPVDRTNIVLGRGTDRRPVSLPLRARQEHVFVLGGSGSGKSRELLHYMRQGLRLAEGLMFLDPHGDHADSGYRSIVLHFPESAPGVYLIDLGASHVLGFNPLACPEDTDPSVIVGNVMDALAVSWEGESFAQKPTIERNLSSVLSALVELKLTLCEAEQLLDYKDQHGLRRFAIQHVKDSFTRSELQRLHELSLDGRRRRDYDQEIIGSVNRLTRLLRPPVIRAMLGQTENCLDFRQIFDTGGVILANLSGGAQVYERDADLFGRLLTRTALFHAKRRRNTRPFNLVLDEAHRFLSSDIPVLLAEVRKYGISVVAAMQWLEQARAYDENILAALLNVNCKICFRLQDAEEAEKLARSIVPLQLERPVAALIKPTVIGHRRISLANESDSEQQSRTNSQAITRGETRGFSETKGKTVAHTVSEFSSVSDVESSSEMESASEGESAGSSESASDIMIPTGDEDIVSRTTAGHGTSAAHSSSHSSGTSKNTGTVKSRGTMVAESHAYSRAETRSHATSRAETEGFATSNGKGHSTGVSEALEPILANLPTAVHSIQNELYAAGLLLHTLPTAVGYLNYVGRDGPVATLFTVPPVATPQVSDVVFRVLRDRLLGKASEARPLTDALKAIAERKPRASRVDDEKSVAAHPQREETAAKNKKKLW